MGFIHYNTQQDEQVDYVKRVKAHTLGTVVDPVCMKPSDNIIALDQLKLTKGFGSVLITDTGDVGVRYLVHGVVFLPCRQ